MNNEEFTGRYHDGWVSRRFVLPLRNIKKESSLTIEGRRLPYPEKLDLSIYVNGQLIHQASNLGGQFSIRAEIPPLFRGNLEIVASDTFVPKEKGINEDERKLSFLLDEIIVPGLPDLMEPYVNIFSFKPSKKVYFLEEEVWDELSFLLADTYKIPDKEMLEPLKGGEWWGKIQPLPSSSLKGTVYDKFSGQPLEKAEVQIFDRDQNLIMEIPVHHTGDYEFNGLAPGEYMVKGTSKTYGDQEIRVQVAGYGKLIHIPMLPLS
ncbi:carboxypeptidase-like regulatory domain-containing protein [Effusibacillus lacus]|uniref:Carboxypeptidase regulatory-like domain-containing protein n=1 Tax=Effusibacillus lacus TaxID=1348429 RepID=A0A292YTA0_9BACL|nr:carboxypeptidase-like regulatory domain-containing protein [Effusibacillus lacus]TCS73511.1 carboxypeptidase family protein [Effusibacillus lacus]GAX91993.1 carboxypeptidase regulatory-like domain-containing protein [Effusibacillus lacus]